MEENFSKALIGYNAQEVNQKLNQIEREINEVLLEHKKREKNLTKENLNLKKDINEVYEKMKSYKDLRKDLEKVLYNLHIEAVTEIYNSEIELEKMIKDKNEIIKSLEDKNEQINLAINTLILNINNIMEN